MHLNNLKNIMIAAFIILALYSGAVSASEDVEKKKIDFLISSVENFKDAKFIRNGSEHDGKESAKHLRLKLQRAGDRVKTAEDFINLCTSKSYSSGKPYRIRLSTGKIIQAEEYFREKLKEYR